MRLNHKDVLNILYLITMQDATDSNRQLIFLLNDVKAHFPALLMNGMTSG